MRMLYSTQKRDEGIAQLKKIIMLKNFIGSRNRKRFTKVYKDT